MVDQTGAGDAHAAAFVWGWVETGDREEAHRRGAVSAAFVIEGEGLRVGMVTDLGHATTLVLERLRGCDVLMVESNHDDRMLEEGPYPWQLKRRVSGRLGHLSNREAAVLLREAVDGECRVVVLAHLSEKNNTRELARRSAAAALIRAWRTWCFSLRRRFLHQLIP